MRAVMLIFSISIHAIFEGIALTMQCKSWHDANSLGISLIPHKIAVGLTLGFRLKKQLKNYNAISLLVLWASITPIGQILAMFIASYFDGIVWVETLNAFALGTFFYQGCRRVGDLGTYYPEVF